MDYAPRVMSLVGLPRRSAVAAFRHAAFGAAAIAVAAVPGSGAAGALNRPSALMAWTAGSIAREEARRPWPIAAGAVGDRWRCRWPRCRRRPLCAVVEHDGRRRRTRTCPPFLGAAGAGGGHSAPVDDGLISPPALLGASDLEGW